MAVNFKTFFGLATIIGFFICSRYYKVSALKCYDCQGEEACQKENLGKNGTIGNYPSGTYGVSECHTEGLWIEGSEVCVTAAWGRNRAISGRGCSGSNTLFEKSKLNKCHLEDGSNWAKQAVSDLCICFTDFCNGDPPNCCIDGEANHKQ